MPKALGRLKTILRRGLDATAALWPEVHVAYGWVHRAAHILHNDASAVDHFLKVSRSCWPGLFHCYSIPDLPRTNNDLEQFFGAHRCHERRTTGRKGATPGLVLRGSVRLVAWAVTRIRPFASEELVPETVSAWQELRHALETRRQQRTQRRRFRRDPASYLATLEADLLKLILPP